MWTILITDKINKQKMYLREGFNDGKIITFDYEEDTLRLTQELNKEINLDLLISFEVSRFMGDLRKEKFKKYNLKYSQRTITNILSSISL